MQKVFDIAKTDERKVCEEMGKVQRSLDAEISRLEELESYRRNYAEQFRGKKTLSPARWQDYQKFLQRIDAAVDAQREQVLAGRKNRDAHRRQWLAKKQKLDSLERVVDRHRKTEDQEEERRSQRALDDMTSTGCFTPPGTAED